MAKEHVERWGVLLEKMKENRHGRVVKDDKLEDELVAEMESLFSAMTREEREAIERPERPMRKSELSLIAHNDRGYLVGYDDEEDCL